MVLMAGKNKNMFNVTESCTQNDLDDTALCNVYIF